ncbi:MAG: DUF72 domain-containing protein [Candidatus Parvarchaeota archaeon]|nr:DUF72 domain-containing protein [Candidatus Parvarchaeum tengchongense]
MTINTTNLKIICLLAISMKMFVGTSGWNYSWNGENTLDWYVKNTKFNAIELNYSFYRFPTIKSVLLWKASGKDMSWSVKMNRIVTHRLRLNENSYKYVKDFIGIFKKSKLNLDNILFQLPPSMDIKNIDRIIKLADLAGKDRAVFEARNTSFFNENVYKLLRKKGITLASIDSPIGNFYVKTTDKVYLRLHGRKTWYNYRYSRKQLVNILESIEKLKPKSLYVFFNNTDMFNNAKMFVDIINEKHGNLLRNKQRRQIP